MTCDGTALDELVAGDDWVWDYSTSDDVSGWSEPLVVVSDANGTILATSATDDLPDVVLDGGLDGAVPATDFDAGVFAWYLPAETTEAFTAATVTVAVRALVDGVDRQVKDQTYQVSRNGAQR